MNLLDLMVKIGVDDQASDKVAGIGSNIAGGLGKAVGAVAKVGAAAVAAGTAAAVALGKASIDAYAENEQLWGGVQKLYGAAGMSAQEYADSVGKGVDEVQGEYAKLRQAEGMVAQNAQQAFRTAGMSANEYMSNATQFSASLINSLGGDTVKAAELTDVAMRAISDNVNTFGSDAKDVTNAVIGLSRQNYTMIDNLKLGYSGTAQGMLELINDSGVLGKTLTDTSELAGVGFDKMIEAIQAVQEQQGIAGTTAREAATTIEGSIGMARGAWANFITELGKEDGDIPARMQELVDSVFTVLTGSVNEKGEQVSTGVIGLVQRIVEGLQESAPQIMSGIGSIIETLVPTILDAIVGMIPMILSIMGQIASTVMSVLPGLFQQVLPVLASQLVLLIDSLSDAMPGMLAAAGELISTIIMAIIQYGPSIVLALINLEQSLLKSIIQNIPNMLNAAKRFLKAMLDGFIAYWPTLKAWLMRLPSLIVAAIGAIGSYLLKKGNEALTGIKSGVEAKWPDVKAWFASLPSKILSAIGNVAGTLAQKGRDLLSGFKNGIVSMWGSVSGWISSIPGRILGALGNLGSLLWDAGYNVMMGFKNGITNGITSAVNAAKSAASSVVSAAKSALGIKSPSRVFIKLGEYTMEGFQKGLESAFIGDVKPYMDSIANGITSPFSAVSASSSSVGVASPTYILQIGDIMYNTDSYMDEAIDRWFEAAARRAGQYGIAK